MKVYVVTRSYPDSHGSHVVGILHEKIRAEALLTLLNSGIESTLTYKLEEREVI